MNGSGWKQWRSASCFHASWRQRASTKSFLPLFCCYVETVSLWKSQEFSLLMTIMGTLKCFYFFCLKIYLSTCTILYIVIIKAYTNCIRAYIYGNGWNAKTHEKSWKNEAVVTKFNYNFTIACFPNSIQLYCLYLNLIKELFPILVQDVMLRSQKQLNDDTSVRIPLCAFVSSFQNHWQLPSLSARNKSNLSPGRLLICRHLPAQPFFQEYEGHMLWM